MNSGMVNQDKAKVSGSNTLTFNAKYITLLHAVITKLIPSTPFDHC